MIQHTPTGDTNQLMTLVAISQTLAGTLNLKAALHNVLKLLQRHHSMMPGMVTLLDRPDGELAIAAAHGLSRKGLLIAQEHPAAHAPTDCAIVGR